MFDLTRRICCAAALLLATGASAQAAPPPTARAALPASTATAAPQTGRATINGVDYYYELHGQGEPLLLLHGGLGSIDMFRPMLAKLAPQRRIVAVDLQGHGRTPLGSRPFRLESIGDDMATLTQRLGFAQVDVFGYSLGGGVALRMALQAPQAVRRLVLLSTPCSDAAFYPEIREQQNQISAKLAPQMRDTPMYQSYAAVAPNVDEFPRLLDTLGDYMRKHYDWSKEVSRLQAQTLLVYGDADMFRPEHEIQFYQLIGGGLRDAGWGREKMSKNRLAIVPDATHYDIFTSPRLLDTILPFLNGQTDAKSWAEQVAGTK